MSNAFAKIEPALSSLATIAPRAREATGLPPLPEDQALIAEAAKAAGLGPWIRYGASADCMSCSAEAARVFGVEPDRADTEFLEFWSFIHPDHRDRVARMMESTRQNPRPYAIEYAINLPNGETRYVAETGQPFFDAAGRLTHFLGAFQDITDRRHPDGEPDMDDEQKPPADGDHRHARRIDAANEEIKSLLDIIITSSELMLWQQEGELPESCRGYTSDIRRSGMDLKLVVEELLAAVSAGRDSSGRGESNK